jgi:hypothetical protein
VAKSPAEEPLEPIAIPHTTPREMVPVLRELAAAVNKTYDVLIRQGVQRDKRIRTQRALNYLSAGAVIVAVLLSIIGVRMIVDANSERTARSFGSCLQQRQSAIGAIAAADDHDSTLAELLVPFPRSKSLQDDVDASLGRLHASSVRKNPLRLCTHEGIDAFLSGRGGYEPTTTTLPPK